MLLAWLFVLVPLVLYLAAFVVEAVMSFKRLSNPKSGRGYLDATWEITHTFLVVSLAFFINLFSQNLTDIARASFVGLFLAAIFIGARGLMYIYIFYLRPAKKATTRNWADWLFAVSHLGIVAGVVVLLVQLLPVLFRTHLVANTNFIPWMWPGLVIVLALCLLPIMSLYHTKNR